MFYLIEHKYSFHIHVNLLYRLVFFSHLEILLWSQLTKEKDLTHIFPKIYLEHLTIMLYTKNYLKCNINHIGIV